MRYVPWLGRDLFHPLFSVTTSLWQVHSWPSYYSKSHKQGFSNKIQCSQIGRKLSIHNEIVSRTLSCLENFSSGYRFFSLSLEPWEWCCLWGSRSSILPKRNDCQKLLGDSTEGGEDCLCPLSAACSFRLDMVRGICEHSLKLDKWGTARHEN